MNITGGATDVTTYFVMRLAATGVEATGLTIANMDLQYVRTGAEPAAKVDATALAATNTAHTDNYGIEIDATDQPGLYRVDWPDAAFAAGVKQVILSVKCATCFTEHMAVDIDTPVNVTRISDDSTAADNCELMFDGTGYAGGTTKLKADLETIKTQSVTCAAGVTVLASVGTAATSTAQTGDGYAVVNSGTYGNAALNTKLGTPAGASVSADILTIDNLVDDLEARIPALALTTGTVATSGGNNTASSFYTDLAGGDGYWTDCLILITSGALAGQVKEIGDFADTNGVVTLTSGQAFTATPADGVTFAILNR